MTHIFGHGKFMYGSFTKETKKALGLEHHDLSNFPQELNLNLKPKLPVPALGHADKPRTFNFPNLEIFFTPNDSFKLKLRDVFANTKLTHHIAKESHRWLNPPDMKYWPQQLNFAVWCATTGCGISSKMLFEDSEVKIPKQVRSFLWFHVYFTTRRVLHELGGIQSSVALPSDSAFDQTNNTYDIPSYKNCATSLVFHQEQTFVITKG